MTRTELLEASARGMLFSSPMVQAILAGQKTRTMRAIKPQPTHHYRDDCPANRYYDMGGNEWACAICGGEVAPITGRSKLKPRNKVGDIVYVREAWQKFYECEIPDGHPRGAMTELSESHDHVGEEAFFCYRADGEIFHPNDGRRCNWRPTIHMPRTAARTFLRITDVRAERLRDSFLQYVCSVSVLQDEGIDIGDNCRECIDNYGEPCCRDEVDEDGSTIGACGLLDDNLSCFEKLWDSINKKNLAQYGSKQNPWCWVYTFERVVPDEG